MTFLIIMALLIIFVAAPLAIGQAYVWWREDRRDDAPLSEEWRPR